MRKGKNMKTVKVASMEDFLEKLMEAIREMDAENPEPPDDVMRAQIAAEEDLIKATYAVAMKHSVCPACLFHAVGHRAIDGGLIQHTGDEEETMQ
jgi:chorismate mutase